MKFKISLVFSLLLAAVGLSADDTEKTDELKALLESRLNKFEVEYIAESAIDGLYEVFSQGQLLYVTKDGNHLINGSLFNITDGIVNVSEETKQRIDELKYPLRRELLAKVSDQDMIVFAAENEKHRISVFTDVDCGYCRKLHREIEQLNDLGITVRYLGYPRAGIGSSSHIKLRSIWCADDPNAAMTRGKIDREFGTDTCDDPLVDHMKLVRQFGLSGTPAIIFESGRLVPGYVEAPRLLRILNEDQAAYAAKTNSQESTSGQ